MADEKIIARVHGDYYTYIVKEISTIWSVKYYLSRDDGKYIGSFSSRADAVREAYKKAGPKAFE